MKVDFEIHHVVDKPGYLHNLLSAESKASHRPFVETLSASANGVGIVVGTRTGRGYQAGGRRSPGTTWEERRGGPDIFLDTANPNPTFLYEAAERFEAIVSLDRDEPRPVRLGDAVVLLDLLTFVAKLAAEEAQAPLLSVQCPAQLPPRENHPDQNIRSHELPGPPHSCALALRFAIALHEPTAEKRIRLAETLQQYCNARGLGMWLSDGRPGGRPSNWFQVCSCSPSRSAGLDDPHVNVCIPVTFVGPARIGSTLAISSYLQSFANIGITACSITAIDDLAFISVQLTVPGLSAADVDSLNMTLRRLRDRPRSPAGIIRMILRAAAERADTDLHLDVALDLAVLAGDYKVYFKSAFPCVPSNSRRRMAVWFSWQTARTSRSLSAPLVGLYNAFREVGLPITGTRTTGGESPNLEYLICRQINGTVLRGKGKISVPKDLVYHNFGHAGLEVPPAEFCALLERHWKNSLDPKDAKSVTELTVAWREFWLGHWSSAP
jgi:hypothetical protein